MNILSSKKVLLFSLLFFLMFAVVIGDNVSETLLLTFYATDQLSLMFTINAAALFLISLSVISSIDKIPRFKFFTMIITCEILFLCLIWICIFLDIKIAYLFLFCFAYIGKILLFLAFWTIANDLCDSREAKSLFPLIGASGIIGGTIACFSTAYMVNILGPSNLIFVWILLLLLSLLVMFHLNKIFKKELSFIKSMPGKRTGFLNQLQQDMALVSREPLLRSMSILYFIVFFLLISLDFHFLISLKSNLTEFLYTQSHKMGTPLLIGSEDFKTSLSKELSSFLGIFRGIANATTFFIQIWLAGLILRTLGTVRSMFILPVIFTLIFLVCFIQAKFGILPESLALFSQPFQNSMFLIIILGTASRIAMFDSIFSPNFQIFFSSLPTKIRGRGKIFIEGLTKPLAILLAGGSVMWISKSILQHSPELIWIHFLALFIIGFILCFIVLMLQRGYTDSISRSLGGNKARQIASVLKCEHWKDTDKIVELLITQLFDPDSDIRNFSIEILCQLDNERARKTLDKVLKMKTYSDRPRIIYSLGRNYKLKDRMDSLESWLWDEDKQVITAAIDAVRFIPFSHTENLIRPYIQHEYPPIATRAISVMWKDGNDLLKKEIVDKLRQLITSTKPEDLQLVMETVSDLADPELIPLLKETWTALNEISRHETTRNYFIECLSAMPDKDSIETVFNSLNDASEAFRKRIFKKFSQQLPVIQRQLPHWIQNFNENQVQHLIEFLFRQRLRPNRILRKLFRGQLQDSIKQAYILVSHIKSLEKINQAESTLLMYSIIEGPLFRMRLKISRLLALEEPSGSLFYTSPRLLSDDKFLRTTAIEALETTFPRELHEKITPLFLEKDYNKILEKGRETWNVNVPGVSNVVDYWIHDNFNKWVTICALFYLISRCPDKTMNTHLRRFQELLPM